MHCLNVKLTYDCSNRCSFCFSSHLHSLQPSSSSILSAIEEGSSKGCRELVLSGGEPTLVPDSVVSAMENAERLGYTKYIVQTNGFGLASKESMLFRFLASFSRRSEVCVSFSIHGHTAETHDAMCSNRGAFKSLLNAVRNISGTDCRIYTNTVVSSLNMSHLREIAELVLPFNPNIIQFAMMHLESPSPLATRLVETAQAIRCLGRTGLVPESILRTEGIPFCLMHGFEHCVGESYWPNQLDLLTCNDKYLEDFSQIDSGMRWKAPNCGRCIMNCICPGIWKEHAREFCDANIRPIA